MLVGLDVAGVRWGTDFTEIHLPARLCSPEQHRLVLVRLVRAALLCCAALLLGACWLGHMDCCFALPHFWGVAVLADPSACLEEHLFILMDPWRYRTVLR